MIPCACCWLVTEIAFYALFLAPSSELDKALLHAWLGLCWHLFEIIDPKRQVANIQEIVVNTNALSRITSSHSVAKEMVGLMVGRPT